VSDRSPDPHAAATVASWASGFLPLPCLVVGLLMLSATGAAKQGNVDLLYIAFAAVPGAVLVGPWNSRRVLRTIGDPIADATARWSLRLAPLGLLVMLVPFGLLVAFGWIGIVIDLGLVAVIVPVLARGRAVAGAEQAARDQVVPTYQIRTVGSRPPRGRGR